MVLTFVSHFYGNGGTLILMTTALAATFVFHTYKAVDWKLALVIDSPTDIMAFVND